MVRAMVTSFKRLNIHGNVDDKIVSMTLCPIICEEVDRILHMRISTTISVSILSYWLLGPFINVFGA